MWCVDPTVLGIPRNNAWFLYMRGHSSCMLGVNLINIAHEAWLNVGVFLDEIIEVYDQNITLQDAG